MKVEINLLFYEQMNSPLTLIPSNPKKEIFYPYELIEMLQWFVDLAESLTTYYCS